jgi:hypothetical protein
VELICDLRGRECHGRVIEFGPQGQRRAKGGRGDQVGSG